METFTKNLTEEWFWAMMQFFVVAITLFFIYKQVKVQAATHIVQTLNTICNRWNSESMMRARYKVCSDWVNGEHKFDGVDEYVAEFMEELSAYLKIEAVPPKTLWGVQSWNIEHYYCMFRDGIIKMREENKEVTLYQGFEKLYEAMQEVSRDMQVPNFERKKLELDRFAKTELVLTKEFLSLQSATLPITNLKKTSKLRND